MDQEQVNFGQFRLDIAQRKLFRDDRPVKLGGRALDILCMLASAGGAVVSKDEIMEKVWQGVIVEENNLQVHISALRKLLASGADDGSYLVTVPGRGYRLIGLPAAAFAGPTDADAGSVLASAASIAVLPFQNMSDDPEQEYFADGMVEDIITGLSRIRWLMIIARNSSFAFKGQPVDVKQIGRQLEVRYLLQGSVRKAATRVRVSVQLIDARTGGHLWAERFDRAFDDIFALQDDIAMSVIGAIEPSLRNSEVERVKRNRPGSLDAYDLVLRALPFVDKRMSDGAAQAIPLLEKAIELEPNYPVAHALLAQCFHFRFSRGGLSERDRALSIHHARAAMVGSDDATALAIAGIVIWFDEHDSATAFKLFDRALAISPSNVTALGNSAFALAWMGEQQSAIERAERAIRLSPFDTLNSHLALSVAYFHLQQYDNARDSARQAVASNPTFSVPHALLAAALSRLGQIDQAKAEAKIVLQLDPTFSTAAWSVTVGLVPAVYVPIATALNNAGILD